MKVSFFIMLSIIALIFTSCDNNLSEARIPENNTGYQINSRSENMESIKFIYHGKVYESTYIVTEDSTCLYQNPEVNKLTQFFDHTPGLVSFYYPNMEVEYFDSDEDFKEKFDKIKEKVKLICEEQENNNFNFRFEDDSIPDFDKPVDVINHNAELWLYDDIALMDRREDLYLNRGEAKFEWAHLKNKYNMNDKTSSFIAQSISGVTMFELYEDDNYKSHCMKFMLGSTSDIKISGVYSAIHSGRTVAHALAVDLHDCDVAGTKRSTWNDRITSVRISRVLDNDLLPNK